MGELQQGLVEENTFADLQRAECPVGKRTQSTSLADLYRARPLPTQGLRGGPGLGPCAPASLGTSSPRLAGFGQSQAVVLTDRAFRDYVLELMQSWMKTARHSLCRPEFKTSSVSYHTNMSSTFWSLSLLLQAMGLMLIIDPLWT